MSYRGGESENLAMAFVSSERLGLTPGQRYYGFSFFAPDVDAARHDLTDPTTFPRDSADNDILPGDGADFYGGVSGWFVANDLSDDGSSMLSGAVFVDLDRDGVLDPGEAALDGVTVSLVADTNGNGVYDPGVDQVLTTTESGADGGFFFAGVPAGRHFVVLDADDTDIPPSLQLPAGTNPITVDVVGGEQSGLNFAFALPLGDDTLPRAVSDSVASPQDQPITIDVLANDIDPVGGGLTLVSVGSAQNGTAAISGTQVTYTPNFGHIGNDSFVYVIEDSVGQQATGTVTVNMLQFSDINDNGIDDYIECGCTDIRLIAGVDGVGVGGMGLGFFSVAAFGLLARLRRLTSRPLTASSTSGGTSAVGSAPRVSSLNRVRLRCPSVTNGVTASSCSSAAISHRATRLRDTSQHSARPRLISSVRQWARSTTPSQVAASSATSSTAAVRTPKTSLTMRAASGAKDCRFTVASVWVS